MPLLKWICSSLQRVVSPLNPAVYLFKRQKVVGVRVAYLYKHLNGLTSERKTQETACYANSAWFEKRSKNSCEQPPLQNTAQNRFLVTRWKKNKKKTTVKSYALTEHDNETTTKIKLTSQVQKDYESYWWQNTLQILVPFILESHY